jgi:cytochrome c biogenesis protein CcmG/thiol:disulfide interchange protein DsbE
MKGLGKLLAVAVAALVAGQLLAGRSHRDSAVMGHAPPLSLPDLGGRKVSLSSLRGRVVAVNFWATWCVPCQLEISELAAFWRENHDRCFEMLGVAEESGSPDQIARVASGLHIPYVVLVDGDGAVAESYRVPGYPRTYVIDADGRVRRVFDGAIRKEELKAAVRPLLPASSGTCPRA